MEDFSVEIEVFILCAVIGMLCPKRSRIIQCNRTFLYFKPILTLFFCGILFAILILGIFTGYLLKNRIGIKLLGGLYGLGKLLAFL